MSLRTCNNFAENDSVDSRTVHQESKNRTLFDVLVTPPPPSPSSEQILLLEGDQYHFSEHGGIARSFYRLEPIEGQPPFRIAIEEHYDIGHGCKSFLVREMGVRDGTKEETAVVHLGRAFDGNSLRLQEILEKNNDDSGSKHAANPGTGSRTWDSSLAMAMFFGQHPELLKGRCIELGSGVGLGGILSRLLQSTSLPTTNTFFQSFTLTDHQDQVLDQCRENLVTIFGTEASMIDVAQLNWHDFLTANGQAWSHAEKYDTVLACDCAYLYPDILALATTIKRLLRKNADARCYIFGPNNRGGLHQLIRKLREDGSYQVEIREMSMARYRLGASIHQGNMDDQTSSDDLLGASSEEGRKQRQSDFHSKTESTILLVTFMMRQKDLKQPAASISDID